jgi:CubicO group peptidase (beta-lactamase class C family)
MNYHVHLSLGQQGGRIPVRFALSAVLAVVCTAGTAQTASHTEVKARLGQVASSYTADNAFMGTVLVVDGDQVLLDKGYGMAVLEWNISNTPDTKFRLGSVTKQFTAALVLLMQQDGKLNINDPVSKYLPDAPKAWEKITLAHLLGHTSGIPNFTSFEEFDAWAASAHTWDEEYAFFRDKPLDFEPGTKFSYSNSNFEVLGGILEKVSGKKYGELLRERIFDRLGMNDSGLDSDDLILPKRAEGYMPGPKGLRVARSESMSVPFSAGSIYSTTGDLLKWEHGLFEGKLLSADSLKAMTTPGKGDYGLGVMIHNEDGVNVVEHGGGIEGFNSNLIYVPDKRICVVVLANVNGAAPGQMGQQLLDVALGKPVVLASERKAEPIAKEELVKFVGVYDLTPDFSLTIAQAEEELTVQGTGQDALPLMYLGVKDGHPRFFISAVASEIEFVPDAAGSIQSLILHQNGANVPGKKH